MAENKNKKSGNGIGIGAALGVAFGAAYGISSGNTSLRLAMGLAIGVAIGAIFDLVKNRKWIPIEKCRVSTIISDNKIMVYVYFQNQKYIALLIDSLFRTDYLFLLVHSLGIVEKQMEMNIFYISKFDK